MTRAPTKIPKRGGHPLSFQDKSIQCSDCGTTFTFSAGEQEQFASRGYTNESKCCPSCRQTRKASSTETVATVMGMVAMATGLDAKCSHSMLLVWEGN